VISLLQLCFLIADAQMASGRPPARLQKETKEEKEEKKKDEPFKIEKLTQGMGLYGIGPVSPDGQSILLIAQKPEQTPNLYVMTLADKSIRPPLTNFKWGAADPAWAPDGQSIAFAGFNETAGFPEVYVLEFKSGRLKQLTRNSFNDREPVFSPDGNRVFYSSDESPLPDAAFGILHVASARLTGEKGEFFTEDEISSNRPGISSDGKSVLLVKISEASGRHSLLQYSLEGKFQRDLTETRFARIHRYINIPGSNSMVLWAQEEAQRQDQLYILEVKSGAVRELPDPDLPKRNPSVSRDGRLIVFTGIAKYGGHLFLYDIVSGEMKQLTYKGFHNYSPVFGSNSTILFGSDRAPDKELYQIDLSQPKSADKKDDKKDDKKKEEKKT
jgi:Tol biopolymer transport system component